MMGQAQKRDYSKDESSLKWLSQTCAAFVLKIVKIGNTDDGTSLKKATVLRIDIVSIGLD